MKGPYTSTEHCGVFLQARGREGKEGGRGRRGKGGEGGREGGEGGREGKEGGRRGREGGRGRRERGEGRREGGEGGGRGRRERGEGGREGQGEIVCIHMREAKFSHCLSLRGDGVVAIDKSQRSKQENSNSNYGRITDTSAKICMHVVQILYKTCICSVRMCNQRPDD